MGYASIVYLLGEDTAFILRKDGFYMDIEAIEDLSKSNFLYMNGKKVKGAWDTPSDDYCIVSKEVLKELLRTEEDYVGLKKRFSHMQQMIAGGAVQTGGSADKKELDQARVRIKELENSLADAGVVIESLKKELETARKPDMSEIRALSADVRAKKRDRGFALTISLSIRGYGNRRIVQELSNEGYGTSKASIARALSVTKDGDRQRIKDIMALHPECFEGISDQDFEKWFSERYEKLTKAARIKEESGSGGS